MSERLSSPRAVTSGNFTSDVDKRRALKLISIFTLLFFCSLIQWDQEDTDPLIKTLAFI